MNTSSRSVSAIGPPTFWSKIAQLRPWRRRASDGRNEAQRRRAIYLWALGIAALLGILRAGEPVDAVLEAARDHIRAQPASGQIVIVAIDRRSIDALGGWPLPRRVEAEAIDRLFALGARRVFFARTPYERTGPVDDAALIAAFARHSGRVFVASRPKMGSSREQIEQDFMPLPEIQRVAGHGTTVVEGGALATPQLASYVDEGAYRRPSLAALIANRTPAAPYFRLDLSIRSSSVPRISMLDVMDRPSDLTSSVQGRDVVLGPTNDPFATLVPTLSQGYVSATELIVLGAETLLVAEPTYFGWLPLFGLAALVSPFILLRRGRVRPLGTSALLAALILVLPLSVEPAQVTLDAFPALALIAIVAVRSALLRRSLRLAEMNTTSGLQGLQSMRKFDAAGGNTLVALKLTNLPTLSAALGGDRDSELIQAVVARLRIVEPELAVHHEGDLLVWWSGQSVGPELLEHIEGLHALFAPPLRIDGQPVDAIVCFGIDGDADRTLASRLATVSLAAAEAAQHDTRYRVHSAKDLAAASWNARMLGDLDAAIDAGGISIAYQPQLELRTNRICGVEALARWRHPVRGDIPPIEFVTAAEDGGRIEALTAAVVDRAVREIAEINRQFGELAVSVNLSARLLDSPRLMARVLSSLERHGLPARLLTLELTESAQIADMDQAKAALLRLQAAGVSISIDDYGVGYSNLQYVKDIPADEIKLDRSLIEQLAHDAGSKVLVESTLNLAHALGRRVVAEGVEDNRTLEVLRHLNCDVAQGYYIARPLGIPDLAQLIAKATVTNETALAKGFTRR